jgi:hypothetical protein
MRRFRILLSAAALLAGTAALCLAQGDFAIGSIIRGFELPSRDENGNLRFKISGERAIIISANRIEVQGLLIELFSDNKPSATVKSPSSDYWRLENRLTTSKGVEISRPGLLVSAKEMEWDLAKGQGLLRNNVKVILENRSAAEATP